ncbi:MAG: glucose-6-phosphate isomerase family protein [Candidatus Bathyarchaeia archaeon]|nr:cupin domain-containing protein [Candidatus Bathyarchaeota archaeon]
MDREPYSAKLGGPTGIYPYTVKVERYLEDLREYFHDRKLVEYMLSRGENPLIYVVYEISRESEGEFNVGCTIIYPGKVGDEYYFTKGHFHLKEPTSEVYIGISGEGVILMQDRSGNVAAEEIKPGTIVYIPPGLAHRSINTGKTDLVFLAIYPSDAGHDYETIRRSGFAKLVVERNGKPTIIDNPNYRG